jgi:hypothetical protein
MSEAGPWYIVYDEDDDRQRVGPDGLRRRIRERDYHGNELIRLEDEPEEALRPLHSDALFQQVHRVGPEEAALMAHASKVRGFLAHLAIFVGVGFLVSWAWWLVFWGIAVAGHFTRTASSLGTLRGDPAGRGVKALLGFDLSSAAAAADATPATVAPPAPPVEAAPVPVAAPEPAAADDDPMAAEARREWMRLEPLLAGADERARGAASSARSSLDELLARRRALAGHLAGESDEELTREQAELEAELASGSLDARTRELLETSLEALQSRRKAAGEARTAGERARARSRALLHQLKSLRLFLASREHGGAGDEADLGRLVDGLQEQASSTAEVEEALAEARRAPAAAEAARARAKRRI